MLGVLTAEQLAHTLLPARRDAVQGARARRGGGARSHGRAQARQPRHLLHPGRRHARLARRAGRRRAQGDIVDRSGAVVGTHEGAHAFTVGQRRGLALGVPAADGKPRFVLEVRPVSNTVVVGPKEALAIAEIAGARFTWAGARPDVAMTSRATCRSARTPIRCRRAPCSRTALVTVTPETPLDGVAPGQTAVLYDGTRVLGQFTIDRTVSAVPVAA